MSTENNKVATRRLFDGFNQKGVAIVDEICTPDFVLHFPIMLRGTCPCFSFSLL